MLPYAMLVDFFLVQTHLFSFNFGAFTLLGETGDRQLQGPAHTGAEAPGKPSCFHANLE